MPDPSSAPVRVTTDGSVYVDPSDILDTTAVCEDVDSAVLSAGKAQATPNIPQPWPLRAKWNDVHTSGVTYIEHYYAWFEANKAKFDQEEYLCNWFPLRYLVEYAAEMGLRLRIFAYENSSPVEEGKERTTNYSKKLEFDSHGGNYRSKSDFYIAIRSKVKAEFIGKLNTERIGAGEARPR